MKARKGRSEDWVKEKTTVNRTLLVKLGRVFLITKKEPQLGREREKKPTSGVSR